MKSSNPSIETNEETLAYTSLRISNDHNRLNSLYTCLMQEIDCGPPNAVQN
jgi:hypothetical protein